MQPLRARTDEPQVDPARPRVLAAAALLTGLAYITWRATTLGSGTVLALSIPLYLTELWAIIQLALLAHKSWRVPPAPAASNTNERIAEPAEIDDAVTDIVITAAHHNLADLERSLVGVAAVVGRGRMVVVDDAYRAELRHTTESFGGHYDVTSGAGIAPASVVHGQAQTPTYLWLEAGQVPMPNVLEATAKFNDPEVAVCQTAVGLLNSDSLVHLRRGRDEEALLRDVIGPSLGLRGMAPWIGPASIVRKSAIDAIGGFVPRDPAAVERALVRLHASGWTSAFEQRRLIRAVAPDTLDEYLHQRRIHAIETLRVFRTPENPIRVDGLGWRHRLTHLALASPFTTGLRQLIAMGVVTATLITGQLPFEAGLATLGLFWAVAAGAAAAARRSLGRGAMATGDWIRHGWRTAGADLEAIRAVARSCAATLNSGASSNHSHRSTFGQLPLLIGAVIVLDLGVLARAATLFKSDLLPSFSSGGRVLVLALGVSMLVPMVDVLQVVVLRRQRRKHHRLHAALDIELAGHETTTVDLSPTGAGLLMEFAPAVGAITPVRLRIPRLDGTEQFIRGSAEVRAATPDPSGVVRVGLQFRNLSEGARLALIEYCAIGQAHLAAHAESDPSLASSEPHHLSVDRNASRQRSLQVLTGVTAALGLVTLAIGPTAGSAFAAGPDVELLCTTTSAGDPVAGVEYERSVDGAWQPVGVTADTGCIAVAATSSETIFAASHVGQRIEFEPTVGKDGTSTIVLQRQLVRVLDTTGAGVPEVPIRYFTDSWRDGGSTDNAGEQWVETLSTDITLDVFVAEGRLVATATPPATNLVLGRIVAAPKTTPTDLNGGAVWRPFVDGMEVVPGRYTLRLADGSISKIEVGAGQEVTVPNGIAIDLEVPLPADPELSPTPTPVEIEPTAEAKPTPSIDPTATPAPTAIPTTAPDAPETPLPTDAPEPTATQVPALDSTPTPENGS